MERSSPSAPIQQLAFWRARVVTVKPRTVKRSRRYKLLDRNLKGGVRVTFRIARVEYGQLVKVAQRDEMTVSEVIRDALYELHQIGELEETQH